LSEGDGTQFPGTVLGQGTGAPAPLGNEDHATLPPGTRLHEFEIDRVLGIGGFGIVYLARDLQLHRTVALKEYMPSSLAVRQPGNAVSVRSERHRETFELGLRSFVNEARLLASFDNASLVKVYRFWEQNGTAYMVMPFYEGPTLKAWLREEPQPPSEAWLKRLLGPLLDALALIHADHCYHRDIAPDNILLLGAEQRPLLLDFGAARRVIGDATQALTVILKPGYAPIEQYAEVPSLKQGPWTDVYALSAVLYMAITGRAPAVAVGRMMNDEVVPLTTAAAGRYSREFLAAIDAGLAVRPEQRPQGIAAFRQLLFATAALPGQAASDATVLLGAAALPSMALERGGAAPAAGRRRGGTVALTVGVACLVLAGIVAWYLSQRDKGPAGDFKPTSVAARPATPRQAIAAPPASAPAMARIEPPPAAPVEAARPPFTLVAALEDIVRHGDPLISVNTLADKERIAINVDRMQFRVKSSESGYLYVLFAGTDKAHLQLLFPNALDKNNRISADATVTLPRKGWQITASGPPGTNHIVTMVSREPRDFAAAALKTGETIPEFDLDQAEHMWAGTPSTRPALAGAARCASGAACDAAYGATLIRIEEFNPGK
jgi:hypothetical protein